MKKCKGDYDRPIGKMIRVDDILPSPDELIIPERTVKVTLRLNERTVKFFKEKAKKHHTKYQKMIRSLLRKYAAKYS